MEKNIKNRVILLWATKVDIFSLPIWNKHNIFYNRPRLRENLRMSQVIQANTELRPEESEERIIPYYRVGSMI